MFNYGEKVLLFKLTKANNPSEAYEAWNLLNMLKSSRSVLMNLPDYWKNIYPTEVKNIVETPYSPVVPYFESDKLYYFDRQLINEMEEHGGDYMFEIDYSIMFDTNFTSYIRDFVYGKPLNKVELSFLEMLDSIIKYDFRYDNYFYLIENYSFYSRLKGLDPIKANNHRNEQYLNMVAFERFKSIDSKLYKETGRINYTLTENEAKVITDSFFHTIFNDEKSKKFMNEFENLHRKMMLYLIGIIRINFSSKKSANNKFKEFLDYTNTKLGCYLERETYLAYEYLKNPKLFRIFEGFNDGMKKSKMINLVSNIAWDLSVPRMMEVLMTEEWNGRFFVPFFLTFDERLKDILKMFKVKGILIDRETNQMAPFTSNSYIEYYLNNGVKYDFEEYISNETVEYRKEINKKNGFEKYSVIENEMLELEKVLRCS